MISVCVWGLPQFPENQLIELTKFIHNHLGEIARYTFVNDSSGKIICVYFQKDMMKWELGTEVLVKIEGANQDALAAGRGDLETIAHMIKSLIPNCKYVECRAAVPRMNDIVVHT